MGKSFNFNSFLSLAIITGVAVIGFFGKMELGNIRDNIRAIRSELVPRPEIQLQISAVQLQVSEVKEQQAHCQTQILELQTKMVSLQLEMARKGIR